MSYEYLCDNTSATEGNNRYLVSVPLNSDVTNESTIDKLCKYSPVGRTLSNSLGLTAPCSVRLVSNNNTDLFRDYVRKLEFGSVRHLFPGRALMDKYEDKRQVSEIPLFLEIFSKVIKISKSYL